MTHFDESNSDDRSGPGSFSHPIQEAKAPCAIVSEDVFDAFHLALRTPRSVSLFPGGLKRRGNP